MYLTRFQFLYHPKQKPGRGPQTDKHLPPSIFTGQFLREKKPTFMVWCLYRYLVHDLHTQKRIHLLTGGRDHDEGLVVRERAQTYLDLKPPYVFIS
jgi:hypothetical protein